MVNYIHDPTNNDPTNNDPTGQYQTQSLQTIKMKTTIDLNVLADLSNVSVEELNNFVNGVQEGSDYDSSANQIDLMRKVRIGYLFYKYPQYKLIIESAVDLDEILYDVPKNISKDVLLRLYEFISLLENEENFHMKIDNNELSFENFLPSFYLFRHLNNALILFGWKFNIC